MSNVKKAESTKTSPLASRRVRAVGKTLVSSQMIDRVTARLGWKLQDIPVGLKWFVDDFREGMLECGGEARAGASFIRLNGSVWTADKDDIVPALLSAEITVDMTRAPGTKNVWYVSRVSGAESIYKIHAERASRVWFIRTAPWWEYRPSDAVLAAIP